MTRIGYCNIAPRTAVHRACQHLRCVHFGDSVISMRSHSARVGLTAEQICLSFEREHAHASLTRPSVAWTSKTRKRGAHCCYSQDSAASSA
jgi:hypothetical protein